MAKKNEDTEEQVVNPNPGGELNPDAPKASQPSSIREATDDEKPDPATVANVEEIEQ